MCRHQGRFEAGRILLPKEASWLADFESELLAFPNGRYDDQVDALLQFLDWYSQNEAYINAAFCAPIVFSRPREFVRDELVVRRHCGGTLDASMSRFRTRTKS